jgi:hypothetical protein
MLGAIVLLKSMIDRRFGVSDNRRAGWNTNILIVLHGFSHPSGAPKKRYFELIFAGDWL